MCLTSKTRSFGCGNLLLSPSSLFLSINHARAEYNVLHHLCVLIVLERENGLVVPESQDAVSDLISSMSRPREISRWRTDRASQSKTVLCSGPLDCRMPSPFFCQCLGCGCQKDPSAFPIAFRIVLSLRAVVAHYIYPYQYPNTTIRALSLTVYSFAPASDGTALSFIRTACRSTPIPNQLRGSNVAAWRKHTGSPR